MERVLLIDDAPAAVEPVAYALERAAFEVEMCETLAEGRRSLAKSVPDFVILDLGLPDGDGRHETQGPGPAVASRDHAIPPPVPGRGPGVPGPSNGLRGLRKV